MFDEAMSIFARSTQSPSLNSPAFMRAKRSRFSSTPRERPGEGVPGVVRLPRMARISSADCCLDIGLALLDQMNGAVVEEL